MNDPLEQRLRRDLARLDDLPVRDADAVRSSAAGVARRRQGARRSGAAIASVALVAGVVVAVAAHRDAPDTAGPATSTASTVAASTTTPSTTADSTNTPAPTTAVGGSPWSALPPDPRGAVFYPSVVWTGSDALVVGGNDLEGNVVVGASGYTPATNSWRRLADPLGVARLHPLAVWTGSVLLLIGGDDPAHSVPTPVSAAQRYDPSSDTWSYGAPPSSGFITDRSPFVWTGTELLVWPSGGDQPLNGAPPIAYDPVADSWRSLPSAGIAQRSSAASVWTGTEWIVWGGTTGSKELSDGAAYNPSTNAWRPLARSPLTGRRVSAVWTGKEMLVDAGSSGGAPATGNGELALADGAAYDPVTDSWRTIAQGPAHPGFAPIWTGTYLVMFAKGSGVVYDPARDTWTGCCDERGPFGTPVWTGSEVIVAGGADASSGGAVFAVP